MRTPRKKRKMYDNWLKHSKFFSLVLAFFLLMNSVMPSIEIWKGLNTIETAEAADSFTSTDSRYAQVSGKLAPDGKSINWTVTMNNGQLSHTYPTHEFFLGTGLGAPTNVLQNGRAVTLTNSGGSYYYTIQSTNYTKYVYTFTTAIKDTTLTNYTLSVRDGDYYYNYANASGSLENLYTTINVDKVWMDAPATKPSVTFDLYQAGTPTPIKSYTMPSGTTSYSFSNLPRKDASGNTIVYTVKERPLTGYKQTVKQNSATSWTFTNSNNVGTIHVQKNWLNLPAGVTKPTPKFTLTNINTGQTWTNHTYDANTGVARFPNIAKVDPNGRPYSFSVTEQPISGYYTTYTKKDVYGTKWEVLNNYQGTSVNTCAIPMGITSVSASNFYASTFVSNGSSYIGFNIDVKGTWSVPDSAKSGDTFTLQLPREVSVQGSGNQFYLKTANGAIAGTGTIDVKTNLVTFTLSSYVDTHVNLGGEFTLTGLQANYNYLPTAGTYPLTFTAKYGTQCTRTFSNNSNITYINKDGSNFLAMFPKGIKDIQSESADTLTWKMTVRGDQFPGYTSVTLSDAFDQYQAWPTSAAANIKVYTTDVYANNGYDPATLKPVTVPITQTTNGARLTLDVSRQQDYVIIATTKKRTLSPDGYYSNSMTLPGTTVNAMNEKNIAGTGTGSAPAGDVVIKKVNELYNPLERVEFTLYGADGKTVVAGPSASSASGLLTFSKIPMGLYYLKETKTINGYMMDSFNHEVVVDESGMVTIDGLPSSTLSPTQITNFLPPQVSKNINGNSSDLVTRIDRSFTYNVPVTLPGDIENYQKLDITDVLAPEIDYVDGTATIIIDGQIRNEVGQVVYDTATRTLKLSVNDFAAIQGARELTLRFDAKLNQKAIPNKLYTNSANVDFSNRSGVNNTITSNEIGVSAIEEPAISLEKTSTQTKVPALGQKVPYELLVKNTGNVVLNNIKLTDNLSNLSNRTVTIFNADGSQISSNQTNGSFSLNKDQYAKVTYDLTVTQAMVDSGIIQNTAKVKAVSPENKPVEASADLTLTGSSTPAIKIDKTSDVQQVSKVGDKINYTFTLTNNGQVTLTNVIVSDPMLKLEKVKVADSLAVGQSVTYQASYTVTQEDLNRASIDNTATVQGTSPQNSTVSDQDTLSIETLRDPQIDLVKSSDVSTYQQVGEKVNYTFTIKNIGNVSLKNLTINDEDLKLNDVPVTPSTLNPGETAIYKYTYTIQQEDLDRGYLLNNALVTAISPAGLTVTDPGQNEITSLAQPSLSIVKTVAPKTFATVGEKLTYQFKVTNTSSMTLQNVYIEDPMFGQGVRLEKSTLLPGESTTASAVYSVTQADLDAGKIYNQATARGVSLNDIPVEAFDDEEALAVTNAKLLTTKTANLSQVDAVDQVVEYKVETQNTGNVTLTNVKLSDNLPGLYDHSYQVLDSQGIVKLVTIVDGVASLMPGDRLVMRAKYKVTANDLDRGNITNKAQGEGTPLAGDPITSTDDHTITANSQPQISLEKRADVSNVTNVGDTINYQLIASNSGNTSLKNVTFTDDRVDMTKASFKIINADGSVAKDPATNGQETLALGQRLEASIPYIVTQADLDRGNLVNKAQVSATDPFNTPVTSDASQTVSAVASPALEVEKSTYSVTNAAGESYLDSTFQAVGDRIFYQFTFKNTGNQTLRTIEFSDDKLGIQSQIITLPNGGLEPGASYIHQVTDTSYIVTQADLDAKQVENNIKATGASDTGNTAEVTDSNITMANGRPAYSFNKEIAKIVNKDGVTYTHLNYLSAGDKIYYRFTVTNIGNITLTNIQLKDDLLGLDQVLINSLSPGQTHTLEDSTHFYTVTQADIDAGYKDNTAQILSTEIPDQPVSDSERVEAIQNEDTALDKKITKVTDSSGTDLNGLAKQAGDKIYYELVITNTGNTSLSQVTINDDRLGIKDQIVTLSNPLAPGENYTFTPTSPYTVTQADIDEGNIKNIASVQSPKDATPATDEANVPVEATTNLAVVKRTDKITDINGQERPSGYETVGDRIFYAFDVTNTGSTTINEITINDPRLGINDLVVPLPTPLAPGGKYTYQLTTPYQVSQEDINRGSVHNTVFISTPNDPEVNEGSSTTPADFKSELKTVKSSDLAQVNQVGDRIIYRVQSTNIGNTTLYNVAINDPLPGLYNQTFKILDSKGEVIQSGLMNGQITLEPGQTLVMAADYQTGASDFANGKITNTATTTGVDPKGNAVEASATHEVTATASPSLTLDKTSSLSNVEVIGQEIDYQILVTNTGNVTINQVTLTDDKVDLANALFSVLASDGVTILQANAVNGQLELQPQQQLLVTVPYIVQQADFDAGKIINHASVTGNGPTGIPVTADDTNEVSLSQEPDLTVDKSLLKVTDNQGNVYQEPVYKAVGDRLYYEFNFTNTGNVAIHTIEFTDQRLGINNQSLSLIEPLQPGHTYNYQASAYYTVNQADIDAGHVENTINAVGKTPGADTPPATDQETVFADGKSAATIEKSTQKVTDSLGISYDTPLYRAVGDRIYYQFNITNAGNTSLNEVILNDEKLGLQNERVVFPQPLAPGKTYDYYPSQPHIVTQDNLNEGHVHNTASIQVPNNPTPQTDDYETNGLQATDMTVVKQAYLLANSDGQTITSLNSVNDLVYYEFLITNRGNTSINQLVITDEKLGITEEVVNLETAIEPGQTYSHRVQQPYRVHQGDIDAGEIFNQVTISTPNDPTPATADNHLPIAQSSDMTIEKRMRQVTDADGNDLGGRFKAVGDKVYYDHIITNTGNTTINEVTINDKLLNVSNLVVKLDQALLPGQSYTHQFSTSYTITQADIDAGRITNIVAVTTPGDPSPAYGEVETLGDQTSDTSVIKEAIKVTDASGNDLAGQFKQAGDFIYYQFRIKNTGTTSINSLTISDEKLGISDLMVNLPTNLLPNQEYIHIVGQPYMVTQADMDSGQVLNNVAVSTPNDPSPATGELNTPGTKATDIQLDKTLDQVLDANGNQTATFTQVGDLVYYKFIVTNTGNTSITQFKLSDSKLNLTDHEVTLASSLLPGQSTEYPWPTPYTITQADLNTGQVTNNASVSTPGDPTPAQDSHDQVGQQTPSLTLEKVADRDQVQAIGDIVKYTVLARNTGNTDLKQVSIEDPLVGLTNNVYRVLDDAGSVVNANVQNGQVVLLPGQALEMTAEYSATKDDIVNGAIVNLATATAKDPKENTITQTATETIPAIALPSMTFTKESDRQLVTNEGDIINYTLKVTNTGNIAINKVNLVDNKVDLARAELLILDDQRNVLPDSVTLDTVTLEVGQSLMAKIPYTVTQADIDAGKILNTATATGQPSVGEPISQDAEVTVDVAQSPAIDLEKETAKVVNRQDVTYADGNFLAVGDKVFYKFTLTNTGNQTLNSFTLTDDKLAVNELRVNLTNPLQPGQSYTYEAPEFYTITQDDLDSGYIENTATVIGNTPSNQPTQPIEDKHTVVAEGKPLVTLDKQVVKVTDAMGTQYPEANYRKVGDRVYYQLVVTNEGNQTVSEVTLNDELLDYQATLNLKNSPYSPLAPGDSMTIDALQPLTITQAHLDQGSLENTATATSPGQAIPSTDREQVVALQEESISLAKKTRSVTRAGQDLSGKYSQVGDSIAYDFVITNTGNTTLTSFTFSDDKLGIKDQVISPLTPLAPGESYTYTPEEVYLIQEADLLAGSLENIATVTPANTDTPVTATNITPGEQKPDISLEKTATPTENLKVGDTVTYQFKLTNTGNLPLKNLVLSDPMLETADVDLTLTDTDLAVGETMTYSHTYLLTQADLDKAILKNTATIKADPVVSSDLPPLAPVTSTDNFEIPLPSQPGLTMEKSADVTEVTHAGQIITYQFKLTNTGNVSLTQIAITDMMLNSQGIQVVPDSYVLQPGESTTATVQYAVTQADLDKGTIENIASATGNPPIGDPIKSPESKVTIPVVAKPALTLTKKAQEVSYQTVGDKITYQFEITNTGNITLSDIQLTDDRIANDITLSKTSLAPGEKHIHEAVYTVTQEDIDAGSILNHAKVSSPNPLDPITPVTAEADHTLVANQTPKIILEKSVPEGTSFTKAGDKITYTLKVTNTGNVVLKDLVLNDPMLGGNIPLMVTQLKPGETTEAQNPLIYTVTQEDVDRGEIVNTAEVQALPPGTDIPLTAQDQVAVTGQINPKIELLKDVDPVNYVKEGDTVSYNFTVTNAGNVNLTNIRLEDPLLNLKGIDTVLPDKSLAPGQSTSLTVTYQVTQTDIDQGSILNTATVTGQPPLIPNRTETPVTDTDDAKTETTKQPAVTLVKTANVENYQTVGQVVRYTFTVTNTGNLTLNDLKLTDPMITTQGGSIIMPQTSLAPGESMKAFADYVVQQEDIDAGKIRNTATLDGKVPSGDNIVPVQASEEIPAVGSPQLELIKTAKETSFQNVGDVIHYHFVIRNTGNTTINNLKLADPMLSSTALALDTSSLAPGEETTATGEYTITQADIDKVTFINTATVTGDPAIPNSNPITVTDEYSINSTASPAIELTKSSLTEKMESVGQEITYQFKVKNIGNTSLYNLQLTDPMLASSPLTLNKTSILPGEEATATGKYIVTQADLDAGSLKNTATVTGQGPKDPNQEDSQPVTVSDQDEHVIIGSGLPGIQLTKTASVTEFKVAGDTIDYEFTIENIGEKTLTDVKVSDPMFNQTIQLSKTTLAPGETTNGKVTYTVTQADVDRGQIINKAEAIAYVPGIPEQPIISEVAKVTVTVVPVESTTTTGEDTTTSGESTTTTEEGTTTSGESTTTTVTDIPEPEKPQPGQPKKDISDLDGQNVELKRILQDRDEVFNFNISAKILDNMSLEKWSIVDQILDVFEIDNQAIMIQLIGGHPQDFIQHKSKLEKELQTLKDDLLKRQTSTSESQASSETNLTSTESLASLEEQLATLEAEKQSLLQATTSQDPAYLEALTAYELAYAEYKQVMDTRASLQAQIDELLLSDPNADVSELQAQMPEAPVEPVAPVAPVTTTVTDTSMIDQKIEAIKFRIQALSTTSTTVESVSTTLATLSDAELQEKITKLEEEFKKLEIQSKFAQDLIDAQTNQADLITLLGDLKVENNRLEFSISDPNKLKVLEGYELKLVIPVRLINGMNLDQYLNQDQYIFTNRASVSYDSTVKDTNEVHVVLLREDPESTSTTTTTSESTSTTGESTTTSKESTSSTTTTIESTIPTEPIVTTIDNVTTTTIEVTTVKPTPQVGTPPIQGLTPQPGSQPIYPNPQAGQPSSHSGPSKDLPATGEDQQIYFLLALNLFALGSLMVLIGRSKVDR